MTDREYTIGAAKMKGLSLVLPKRGAPEILAYDFKKKNAQGVFPCVIDALTWADARKQLNNFYA